VANKYYFSTKNLVTIALFGSLGAALSTYVGYLAKAVGSSVGLPAGGQLLTGLHVFWIILVMGLVDKKGAGLLVAILDNVVQFMMGSHLGIFVLPMGLIEGLFAELGFWPLKRYSRLLSYLLAGGLGAWSNLLVVNVAFNMFGTRALFQVVSIAAFLSGITFAGLLPYSVIKILQYAGLVAVPKKLSAVSQEKQVSSITES
jgi:ABC-type thiamin/hydroxymethylpyrimidine transport system permease subunit